MSAALILLGWVFWSLWWPFEPLAVKPGSFEVMNPGKSVARGGTLVVHVNYCKNMPITAQMVNSIEQGSSLWLLSAQYPAFTVGCHDSEIGLVTIPTSLPIEATTAGGTGKAILRVRLNYEVNPLREVVYSFTTDSFTITP